LHQSRLKIASKRFWSYIKTKRTDSTGIAPLNDRKTTYTTAKQKAYALNKQFQSVFTTEDLSNIIPRPLYYNLCTILRTCCSSQ